LSDKTALHQPRASSPPQASVNPTRITWIRRISIAEQGIMRASDGGDLVPKDTKPKGFAP
jgi:hypothetical protein